jgi:hypothetical protein
MDIGERWIAPAGSAASVALFGARRSTIHQGYDTALSQPRRNRTTSRCRIFRCHPTSTAP